MKGNRIKYYRIMSGLRCIYGGKTWTEADKQCAQNSEIKFLQSVVGCKRLDKKLNSDIKKRFYICNLNEKVTDNRNNKWKT